MMENDSCKIIVNIGKECEERTNDTNSAYMVFYTCDNERECDFVVGRDNAISHAIKLAKIKDNTYVTLHAISALPTGVLISHRLLMTFDLTDIQSVKLALQENVPCVDITE